MHLLIEAADIFDPYVTKDDIRWLPDCAIAYDCLSCKCSPHHPITARRLRLQSNSRSWLYMYVRIGVSLVTMGPGTACKGAPRHSFVLMQIGCRVPLAEAIDAKFKFPLAFKSIIRYHFQESSLFQRLGLAFVRGGT
jgi:hypothetical protein